ncbi:unnamed protein product, partial [Laminaria digitata]
VRSASGAVGERITLTGYFVFVLAMVGFIYPVVTNDTGTTAATGTTTPHTAATLTIFVCLLSRAQVHACGGMAALTMAVLIGPRLGRFSESGASKLIAQQSVIMQTLGTFILWVGWYGFNGCSTLYITGSAHIAAKAMVCTTLSAAASGIGVASASMIMFHHVGPREVCNGLFSGLVAITAGCAVVES